MAISASMFLHYMLERDRKRSISSVLVVVLDDLHIERIVLATLKKRR